MGEIQKELYSLIKPFQSPIEENEAAETGGRFRVKSFQKVSKTGNREIRLERYLEKLYVSSDETSRETGGAGRQVKEALWEGGRIDGGGEAGVVRREARPRGRGVGPR